MLEYCEGAYLFRYPYLFFFFLGKYLAEHIGDAEVQQVVRDCCGRLHKQDNGNIILFLAHHSRDERVYESVLHVLQQKYAGEAPMTLDNDVEVINCLVECAPQFVFVDGDVIEKREALRDQQDASAEASRMLIADPDTLPPEVIELLTLVKTIDILGQFLKNHYGQLDAATKERLLRELFNGGMRGMRGILKLLLQDPDGLVRGVEAVLEKRGLEKDPIKRKERAKREMFYSLSFLAYAFIYRCGISVASPHLTPVLDNVVQADPSTSFRLIRSIVRLEKQGGLDDLVALHELNRDIKNNAVAQSILQRMVLGHMHIYSTKLHQKQKVCQELNIKLQEQRALDFKTHGSKRMA